MHDQTQQFDFLNPSLSRHTLDRWYVRRAILEAINCHRSSFHGTFLDVGCGVMPYRTLLLKRPSKITTYVGLDIPGDRYAPPDLCWNAKSMPVRSETIDSAMATEVLEHCPRPDELLSEVYRVLKSGSVFFFTVPFLWPLHDVPFDEYRYTPFSIERLLRYAGFSEITLYALGGWDASLAQLLGLWTRRRPMKDNKRSVLSALAVPVVRYLAHNDVRPSKFLEGAMITGLVGIAHK